MAGKDLVALTHANTGDYKFLFYDNTVDTNDNICSVKAKEVKFTFKIKGFERAKKIRHVSI